MDLIDDLPHGPLDEYRQKASFNWKKMKMFIRKPKVLRIQKEAYEFLETHPVFQHPEHEITLEEERSLTLKRMNVLYASKIFYPDDYISQAQSLTQVLGSYDFSLTARKALLKDFCISAIYGQGTDRHMEYITELLENRIGFAFCLTEIGHGTNTRAMETEARFDIQSQSFILHTPSFEAAKCWAGCLGKTASHCVVFAQLYTPDGVCHGLNSFIVPVRDPISLKTYTGVTVIDMGPKLGLNGIDNGVLMFNKYSISRENLLNKTGDVTEDGKYVSPYKDPNKRFGASLGNLSVGRVGITGFGVIHLSKALAIAIRYSAVRRQFGNDGNNKELPVLEYPLQQWRLFPFLAGMYVLHVFSNKLTEHFTNFTKRIGNDPDQQALYGQEIHALSSVSKPFSGWLARDGIQECREACGGHGYLRAAGFGKLRDDNDANLTYEGDNNVLLQQTSNWLLGVWSKRNMQSSIYPMRTVDFFMQGDRVLGLKWTSNTFHLSITEDELVQHCLEGLEWLVCWLCQKTTADIKEELLKNNKDNFTAKNHSQLYRAHTLSLVYFERVAVEWFREALNEAESSLQLPLKRLCSLFILTRMLKHVSIMVEGGLAGFGNHTVSQMHQHVKRLLTDILPDAVALTDAFAPPDFILQSVLGNADGKVYEHMYHKMITAPNALTRDKDWELISYTKDKLKANL